MAGAHRLLGWLVGGLLCGSLVPAVAGGPPATLSPEAWITRLNGAATERNYHGTMVYSARGVVSSSRVAHACTGDDVYERLEALDGHQQRVYRHNDAVRTIWPHKQVVVVEQAAQTPGLVATRRRVEPRALAHYALSVDGRSVVAGRPSQVLVLHPRDGLRFTQRLLADLETGLLLRTEVLDADGRVLESSGFSEVVIDAQANPDQVLDGMAPTGFTVLQSGRQPVDLVAEGWRLREAVPGFELVGCVRRPAVGRRGADATALQAMYSDGVSFVSLFIEGFDEGAHRHALAAELGATHTVMQRVGDHWITAMGDVPRLTLERFVAALEHR